MKCCVCDKEVTEKNSSCCSSIFGSMTHRYCFDCLANNLEPYGDMVFYIADAGHFPNDINKQYQNIVRHNLKFLNISEEQFIKDVDSCIKAIDEFYDTYDEIYSESEETDFEDT